MSLMKRKNKPKPVFLRYSNAPVVELTELPPLLAHFPLSSQEKLFIAKLRQCCTVFDFNDLLSDLKSKEIKRAALLNIQNFMATLENVISVKICSEIFRMISQNIFRSLHPCKNPICTFEEDIEETLEPAWVHLKLVYQIFYELLKSPSFLVEVGYRFIDEKFVSQVLELFDSDDARERESLRIVLHCLYRKFIRLRAFIRKSISFIFLSFIYEGSNFKGIAELLYLYKCIIHGFVLPLKEAHKEFLLKVLLPLHKHESLELFYTELKDCIVNFIKKDSQLAQPIVRGLLKFWPKTCSSKEIYFIHEIENIINEIDPTEFAKIQCQIFRQIAQSLSSPNYRVAQQVFNFWNNDYVAALMVANNSVIMPIMLPALYEITRKHWHKNAISTAYNILRLFLDTDTELFDNAIVNYNEQFLSKHEAKRVRDELWKNLDDLAAKQAKSLKTAKSDNNFRVAH